MGREERGKKNPQAVIFHLLGNGISDKYWHTLCNTITTTCKNMSLQLTVVLDRPVQIVLDVQDKRKPQQTVLPLMIQYTVNISIVYRISVIQRHRIRHPIW